MMEYNLAYGRLQDSDVTSGFKSGVDALAQSLVDTVTDDEIQTREGYKNIFEDFGLLLHDTSIVEDFYGQSFTKQPGVQEAKKHTQKMACFVLRINFQMGLCCRKLHLKYTARTRTKSNYTTRPQKTI